MRLRIVATLSTLTICGCGTDTSSMNGAPDATELTDVGADSATRDVGHDVAETGVSDTAPDVFEDVNPPDAWEDIEVGADADPDLEPDVEPFPEGVVLNEIFCSGPDFIELYNRADGPIDVGGLIVTDDPDNEERDYRIESGTLQPGEYLLLQREDAGEGIEGFGFGVKCGDDRVSLLGPHREEIDDHIVPEVPVTQSSTCRLPDGGAWDFCAVTPGEENQPAPLTPDDWFAEPIIRRIEITMSEEAQNVLTETPRTDVEVLLAVPDEGVEPMRVMLRLKGRIGSFRPLHEKAGFRIDINDIVRGQRLFGLKQLTLNNMVQDRSLVHEFAAYELFRAVGIAAPRVTYAEVTVNDALYGLYASIEGYDDITLGSWFPETNHLYEGLYGSDLFLEQVYDMDMDEGDPSDRSDLRGMAELLNEVGVEGLYEASLDRIDWPWVAKMMAVELWIDHWDGYARYRNNFFFHFDGDIVLRLLPWGTDQTFVDEQRPLLEGSGYLFDACHAHPDCAQLYYEALDETNRAVEEIDLIGRLIDLEATLWPVAERDPRRSYSMDGHDNAFDDVIEFLQERPIIVGDQVECLLGDDPDPDGDGAVCHEDCRPEDPLSFPGAEEICGDGIDQDCSGIPDDAPECPDCIETPILGTTYWICPTPRTYDEALAHCSVQGAGLAQIESEEENTAVYAAARAVRAQDYWLGMTDRAEEGVFTWNDGSPIVYENWHDGEPNDWGSGEDCGAFWMDDHWNDFFCDQELGVICEAPSAD